MATAEAPAAPAPPTLEVPGGGHEATVIKLRSHIIGPTDRDGNPTSVAKARDVPAATKELPPDDLLNSLSADGRIIMPPFDKLVLAMLSENSTSLGPVISAMAQNIDGFGYHLECRVKIDDPKTPEDIKVKVAAERAMITNFFRNFNPDYSLTEMRRRTRIDMEHTGEGYWEVIKTVKGDIVGFNHIPSYQIVLGGQDNDLSTFTRTVPEIQPDGEVVLKKMASRKRFRCFVQTRVSSAYSRGTTFHRGSELRWFKEFGDPRVIDNRNGTVVTDPAALDELPEANRASELIHFKIYSARTPYGMPRFIGNLITLFGDRASDEINYNTLRNNNVPSMLLMVSNGQLTQASIDRIQEFVNGQIAGQNNYSKFVIIEAEGQYEGQESGIPRINIEKLDKAQVKDQLFQEYSKNNGEKVRQAFRMPPIFIGRSDDYTRSTAEASRRLADEQIFSPEREEFDNLMNLRVMPELGVIYHQFVSNGPNVTDDADLINVMGVAEKSGGMTPRMARQLIADILGMDEHALPPLDPSIKPDVPFTLQIAEAVKNTAEPQHQLAVKGATIEGLTQAEYTVGMLIKLRNDLEVAMLRRNRSNAESAD